MDMAHDRVRRHTASEVLRRIDQHTEDELLRCAREGPAAIDARLQALDREWDTDRVLELEAAGVGLLGLAMARARPSAWLLLPAMAAAGVLGQALTGRYPLMPVFRRLGVRTAREIERERLALKALRGDFSAMGTTPARPAGIPSPTGPGIDDPAPARHDRTAVTP